MAEKFGRKYLDKEAGRISMDILVPRPCPFRVPGPGEILRPTLITTRYEKTPRQAGRVDKNCMIICSDGLPKQGWIENA